MNSGPEHSVFRSLNDADRQLVRMVCSGLTDKEIADRTEQPERVVAERLKVILASIGAASRTQLVISATCHGL